VSALGFGCVRIAAKPNAKDSVSIATTYFSKDYNKYLHQKIGIMNLLKIF